MTTLITGASGFLGGAVARHLHTAGQPVLATGRDAGRCEALQRDLGQTVLRLDLADAGAVATLTVAAQRAGVRRIVHAAALTAPWGRQSEFYRANVQATQTVLDVARALRVERTVLISSPSVYFRFADQEALTEDTVLPPPVNAYAATKRRAERLALTAGAVVLRPRGIYGPGDRALLPRLIRAIATGPLPRLRGGRAATDLTHVADVVAAICCALTAEGVAGQVFNVSGGQALRIGDVVTQVAARARLTPRWREMPMAPVLAAARGMEVISALTGVEPRATAYGIGLFAYRQTLDLSQTALLLGWQPRIAFDAGLDLTFGPSAPGGTQCT